MRARAFGALACALLAAAPACAQQLGGLGLPLLVDVPSPPNAVRAAGRFRLVYELHLTNTGRAPVTLMRVEVLDGERVVAAVAGDEVARAVEQTAAGAEPPQTLASGAHAVVMLWLSLPELPSALRHRLAGTTESDAASAVVEQGPVAVGFAPVRIAAPLRGGPWLAANGPGNDNHHRRSWIAHDGRALVPERFAIDFVLMKGEEILRGSAADNASYYGYGADVLAVADATVVATHDGVPDNAPANRAPTGLTFETIGGNTVVLDLGSGRYAHYAHLRPGSIRVRPGQTVRAGDVLGSLGNSGNSNAPHLHFQIGDGPTLLFSDGVPFALDSFIYAGAKHVDETPLDGWTVTFE